MPKCDFNKAALQLYKITLRHGCFPVNLLYIFKTPFTKNFIATFSRPGYEEIG